MKYNFYLIHGWGFDSDFWSPVNDLLKNEKCFNASKLVDLGFFSKIENFRKQKESHLKDIFIVHSYGLNWFLKKKIECYALVNFFSAPNFISFQRKSLMKKKMLRKMIKKFSTSPEKVLVNFYENCGLPFYKQTKDKLDFSCSLEALEDLYEDDLEEKFRNLSCKICSIYSLSDKIFEPSKYLLEKNKSKNHQIKFFSSYSHGFPFLEPKKTLRIITNFIKIIENEIS